MGDCGSDGDASRDPCGHRRTGIPGAVIDRGMPVVSAVPCINIDVSVDVDAIATEVSTVEVSTAEVAATAKASTAAKATPTATKTTPTKPAATVDEERGWSTGSTKASLQNGNIEGQIAAIELRRLKHHDRVFNL
jgi:hypothetical protein